METSISDARHAVFMQKITGEVGDLQRLVILVQKSLVCMQKPEMRAGTLQTSDSDANHAVLHAKTTEEGWDP